jgi:DNA-binding HxlR family transcriptional regulator
VDGRQCGGLYARVLWPAGNAPGRPAAGWPTVRDGERRCALDWREAQAQLRPVGFRWDLAILCNIAPEVGCRPADILAAINAQAEAGHQLRPQVLSGRLRELERGGYIRHEDLSRLPLYRVYYLQPPGQRLIADIDSIIRPASAACDEDSAARASPVIEQ